MFNEIGRIKVGVPNKGRLREPTIALLQRAGYRFRVKERALYASASGDPLTFIFVRADDIPVLLDKQVLDIGITGEDLVLERDVKLHSLLPLAYGKCRLCVAVPTQSAITPDTIKALHGKTIATSFPLITESFFKSQGIAVNVIEMNGSVEVMISLGLAEAIVDIVETGDSLKDNDLRILIEIGKYQTALFTKTKPVAESPVHQVVRRLEGILIADRYSLLEYNVKRTELQAAELITPGYKSPTLSELEDKAWVAVKVMVEKSSVVKVMAELEGLGAVAIMETPIVNCRL